MALKGPLESMTEPERKPAAARAAGPVADHMSGFLRGDMNGLTAVGELRITPNAPFFLRHDPRSWEKVEVEGVGSMWVPELHRQIVQPGAGLMRTRREHEPEETSFRLAVREGQQRGLTYIDPGEPIDERHRPEGTEPGGYLRAHDCRCPTTGVKGTYYLEVWSRPNDSLPGETQTFSFDYAAYNRWRAWLVASGKIRQPKDRFLKPIVARSARRVERAKVMNVPDSLRAEKIQKREGELRSYAGAARPDESVTEILPAAAHQAATKKGGKSKSTEAGT